MCGIISVCQVRRYEIFSPGSVLNYNGIDSEYNNIMSNTKNKISMGDVFQNPLYQGRHVILAAGKIYTAKTGEGAAKILEKIRKKDPKITPEIAYLPKAHSLILC